MMRIIRGGAAVVFISKHRNRNAYTGIIYAGATINRRDNSYAASVPSELPKPKKPVKRITKTERRAIVEAYVNKYREENNGIFPSTTHIKNKVGGGYYFTKRILQEIRYTSEMSASNEKSREGNTKIIESFTKVDDLMPKKTEEENSLSKKVEKVEEAQVRSHSESVEIENNLPKAAEEASLKSFEKPEDKTNTRVIGLNSDIVQAEKTQHVEESGKFDYPLSENADRAKKVEKISEKCEKEEQMVSESSPDLNVLENKSIEHSNKESNVEEPPKQPTLWGNLKSFAINIWRKF